MNEKALPYRKPTNNKYRSNYAWKTTIWQPTE